MEQATDVEKTMAVSEFLDFKRRNKVCILFVYVVLNLGLFPSMFQLLMEIHFFRLHFLSFLLFFFFFQSNFCL